jgi:hypothetical protein
VWCGVGVNVGAGLSANVGVGVGVNVGAGLSASVGVGVGFRGCVGVGVCRSGCGYATLSRGLRALINIGRLTKCSR